MIDLFENLLVFICKTLLSPLLHAEIFNENIFNTKKLRWNKLVSTTFIKNL